MTLGRGFIPAPNSPCAGSMSSSPPPIHSDRVPIGAIGSGRGRGGPPVTPASSGWAKLDLHRLEMEASAEVGMRKENNLDYYDVSEDDEDNEEDEDDDDDTQSRGNHSWVDDEAVECNEDSEDGFGEPGELPSSDPSRKRRRVSNEPVPVSSDLLSSLFGQPAGPSRQCHTSDGEQSENDDNESDFPLSESGHRLDDEGEAITRTERELFGSHGVRCVGCLLGPRVLQELDAYVFESAATTQPDALWRLAALKYHETFVVPKQRMGIAAPAWTPEAIRIHYEHHQMNERLTRVQMCRYIRGAIEVGMRQFHRREEPSGDVELDKTRTELMIKLFAAESAHLRDLSTLTHSTKRPARKLGDEEDI